MKMDKYKLYSVARASIGFIFLCHGVFRISYAVRFSYGMVEQFSRSPVPRGLVLLIGLILPTSELLTGILLSAGLFTKTVVELAILGILVLIAGSLIIHRPQAMQVFYFAYLVVLRRYLQYNRFSVDGLGLVGDSE